MRNNTILEKNFEYTPIQTINRDEVHHYISTAKENKWCVLRIEPWWDTNQLLLDMKKEINIVPWQFKEPEYYGESYAGVSIQRTKLEKTQEEADFNSVSRNVFPGEKFVFNNVPYYFTREGWSTTPLPNVNLCKDITDKMKEVWDNTMSKPAISAPHYLNTWAVAWPSFMLSLAQQRIICIRGRYLKTRPKQFAAMHVDGECRLHLAIETNDKCYFEFFDHTAVGQVPKLLGRFHIPADGCAYLFNANVMHSFGNSGENDRVHAVFGLNLNLHIAWKYTNPSYQTFDDALEDYSNDLRQVAANHLI
jgi:hypothetical protein